MEVRGETAPCSNLFSCELLISYTLIPLQLIIEEYPFEMGKQTGSHRYMWHRYTMLCRATRCFSGEVSTREVSLGGRSLVDKRTQHVLVFP